MSAAIADKLDEARALIGRGWTRFEGGRDVNGNPVWSGEPSAVAWCALGAMCATGAGDYSTMTLAMRQAINLPIDRGIAEWNDAPERTQAEVIEAFRKAAELARGDMGSAIGVVK